MKKILTTIMFVAAIACAHVPETTLAEPAFQEPSDEAESLFKTASYDPVENDPVFEAIDLNNIQFLVAVLQNGTAEDKQLVFCGNNAYSFTQQWNILPAVKKAVYKKAGSDPKKRENIPQMLANFGALTYCKGFKAKYPDLTRKLGKDFLQKVGNIPIHNGAKGAADARGYYFLNK